MHQRAAMKSMNGLATLVIVASMLLGASTVTAKETPSATLSSAPTADAEQMQEQPTAVAHVTRNDIVLEWEGNSNRAACGRDAGRRNRRRDRPQGLDCRRPSQRSAGRGGCARRQAGGDPAPARGCLPGQRQHSARPTALAHRLTVSAQLPPSTSLTESRDWASGQPNSCPPRQRWWERWPPSAW